VANLNAYFNEYYEVILGALALILAIGFVRMLLGFVQPIKIWFIRKFINKFE